MKPLTNSFISISLAIGLSILTRPSFAHCDTMDGPVVAASTKAIEQNNVNLALIWTDPAYEKEVKEAFNLTMKVRVLNTDARKLADNYFFETVVRIHRMGEGVPCTGIKPAGTPVDEKILAADRSIISGDLAPLKILIPENRHAELKKLFDVVMSLKHFDVNNVAAGRAYVKAYVRFFHFAEGEGEHNPVHSPDHSH